AEEIADRGRPEARVVDRTRLGEGGAPQGGRQRRSAVEVAPIGRERLREVRRRRPVAAVLEHSREELVGGLLGAELRLVLLGRRQQKAGLHLQQRGDEDKELRRGLEVEL